MTEVYVVTTGQYEDYHIVGVYTEKEVADKIAALDADAEVETRLLDQKAYEIKQGFAPWEVMMAKDGVVIKAITGRKVNYERALAGVFGFNYSGHLGLEMFAKDREYAIRITDGLRKDLLANGDWPN